MRQCEKLNRRSGPNKFWSYPRFHCQGQASALLCLLLLDKGALSSLTSQLQSLHQVQLLGLLPRLESPGEMSPSKHSPQQPPNRAQVRGCHRSGQLVSMENAQGTDTCPWNSKHLVFCHPEKSMCVHYSDHPLIYVVLLHTCFCPHISVALYLAYNDSSLESKNLEGK